MENQTQNEIEATLKRIENLLIEKKCECQCDYENKGNLKPVMDKGKIKFIDLNNK